MKSININPNSIFEPSKPFVPMIILSDITNGNTSDSIVYETLELFSLGNSGTRTFAIGTFHRLSFKLVNTAVLSLAGQTQNITNTDYLLEYPKLNTQEVIITLGLSSTLNGIITK